MPNAQQSFVLLWKRVVAALSLIAAALLAPTASAPISGAGVASSRAGSGPAIASAANALIAHVDGVADGGRHNYPLEQPQASGPQGKPCVVAAWRELPAPQLQMAMPATDGIAPLSAFATRSGLSRAPPRA
jgi:hypothetical protein